jgi:SDR family mycofactocin-dependent oxidoreductase
MGRVAGKVAFISGIARGQGRAHALRLAEEGADIIGFDLCGQAETAPYPMATREDLDETVRAVEALGRRIVAKVADARDADAVSGVLAEGLKALGRVDVVVANAGIASVGLLWEISEQTWQEMIDINLTGVWNTVKATVPALISTGEGGSIIVTSSAAGLVPIPRLGHYTAAKHGVTGIAKSFAVELAPHGIRANSLHPGNVNTPMINNPSGWVAFSGNANATGEEFRDALASMNAMPTPWAQAGDISDAVVFLASDESRWVTGTQQVVDAGNIIPFKMHV